MTFGCHEIDLNIAPNGNGLCFSSEKEAIYNKHMWRIWRTAYIKVLNYIVQCTSTAFLLHENIDSVHGIEPASLMQQYRAQEKDAGNYLGNRIP